MFNNKLSVEIGTIYVIFIALIGLIILSAIFGRMILIFYGRRKKIRFSGKQLIDLLNSKHNSTIVIEENDFNFLSMNGKYDSKRKVVKFWSKDLQQKNINTAFNVFSTFNIIDSNHFNKKWSKINFWGLFSIFIFLLIDLLAITLILIFSKNSDTMYNNNIKFIPAHIIEGLSILGWFCFLVMVIWWINVTGTKAEEIKDLAKKYLDKKEMKDFNKYLKIWSYIPFSNKINV